MTSVQLADLSHSICHIWFGGPSWRSCLSTLVSSKSFRQEFGFRGEEEFRVVLKSVGGQARLGLEVHGKDRE